MPEISDFLEEFQASIEDMTLPEELSERYEVLSALGHREEGGVWLLRRRADGARFVLKTDRGDGQDLFEEFRQLSRLPAGLGPEPVVCFIEKGVKYMVHSYLPGQSLDEAWGAGGPLSRWTELGTKLCALLSRLHRLEPPIVHRDIKPENIILSPEGEPSLIDFGIARSYKPERSTDTAHMGTRATAAPEQYGFTQSDQRTDLYALGVTLRWMLTGSYGPEALERGSYPAWAKRFLGKAAAFDPRNRFPSARAMASALARHTAAGRARLAALALVFCLGCAGLALSLPPRTVLEDSAVPLAQAPHDLVLFSSPLLEEAVRAELGRPEGDITYADLEEVRRLAVVGRETLGAEQTYWYCLCSYVDFASQEEAPHGDIADLSLLAHMPNLEVLYLCQQEITGLAPLAELSNLRELYLPDNAIEDLSPLAGLSNLEVLYVGNNPARDLSHLTSLRGLRELNLDSRNARVVDSLAPLAGTHIQLLSAGYIEPADRDWSFLEHLNALDQLILWDPPAEAVEALAGCNPLRELQLCNYSGRDLTALPVIPGLRNLTVRNNVVSLEGIERQERLIRVSLSGLENLDLGSLRELGDLRNFHSDWCTYSNLAPLGELPSLREAELEEANREAFEAACPEPGFLVRFG